MKSELVKNWLPFNLQFFASEKDEKNGEGANDNTGENQAEENEEESNEEDENSGEEEKAFTQSDLNKVATKEKKQGRKAMLKELGFKNENEALKELKAFKAWKESQMTDEEKAQNEKAENENKQNELLNRALKAEQKLAALSVGVRSDSVDDAIAIASLKVTEEKNIDEVLQEMKKESRYSSFFVKSEEDEKEKQKKSGTGSSAKHSKGSKEEENIGTRLGKKRASTNAKSNFFKN